MNLRVGEGGHGVIQGGGAGVVPSGVGVGVATTEGQYGVNVIPGGGRVTV